MNTDLNVPTPYISNESPSTMWLVLDTILPDSGSCTIANPLLIVEKGSSVLSKESNPFTSIFLSDTYLTQADCATLATSSTLLRIVWVSGRVKSIWRVIADKSERRCEFWSISTRNILVKVFSIWRLNARASGTTSSAAAEGVGARTSDTKSDIVSSVSCPIALTTGVLQA